MNQKAECVYIQCIWMYRVFVLLVYFAMETLLKWVCLQLEVSLFDLLEELNCSLVCVGGVSAFSCCSNVFVQLVFMFMVGSGFENLVVHE